MTQAPSSARELQKYLDPKVLSHIHRLDLRTRLIVEGFMTGQHRSPYLGLSVEFAQHREYVPGDDTRHIDWKVYSRTDRHYLKQYEEETNLQCVFLVDVSESMRYGEARPGGLSKFHYAGCVAGSLALLLLRQQDAAGLITFDDDLRAAVPPSSNPNTIKAIVHHLETASGALKRRTSLDTVCHKAASQMARRGMVCLISDLLVEDDDAFLRGLARLSLAGHDVMVLHVLDADELDFPFEGNTRFRGLEEAGDVIVQARPLREGYLEALQRFRTRIQRWCTSERIDYSMVNTADHLGAVLADFLQRRAALGRRASLKRR